MHVPSCTWSWLKYLDTPCYLKPYHSTNAIVEMKPKRMKKEWNLKIYSTFDIKCPLISYVIVIMHLYVQMTKSKMNRVRNCRINYVWLMCKIQDDSVFLQQNGKRKGNFTLKRGEGLPNSPRGSSIKVHLLPPSNYQCSLLRGVACTVFEIVNMA